MNGTYRKPCLFTVNEGGVAHCWEAATGKSLWRENLGGHFMASPVYAEGRLYFLSEEGETTIGSGPGR